MSVSPGPASGQVPIVDKAPVDTATAATASLPVDEKDAMSAVSRDGVSGVEDLQPLSAAEQPAARFSSETSATRFQSTDWKAVAKSSEPLSQSQAEALGASYERLAKKLPVLIEVLQAFIKDKSDERTLSGQASRFVRVTTPGIFKSGGKDGEPEFKARVQAFIDVIASSNKRIAIELQVAKQKTVKVTSMFHGNSGVTIQASPLVIPVRNVLAQLSTYLVTPKEDSKEKLKQHMEMAKLLLGANSQFQKSLQEKFEGEAPEMMLGLLEEPVMIFLKT